MLSSSFRLFVAKSVRESIALSARNCIVLLRKARVTRSLWEPDGPSPLYDEEADQILLSTGADRKAGKRRNKQAPRRKTSVMSSDLSGLPLDYKQVKLAYKLRDKKAVRQCLYRTSAKRKSGWKFPITRYGCRALCALQKYLSTLKLLLEPGVYQSDAALLPLTSKEVFTLLAPFSSSCQQWHALKSKTFKRILSSS